MTRESGTPVLEVGGLRRAFGGLVAVNDLGFAVGQGEIMGLLGPNGSGKTTALNLMSGVLRPDAGTIRLLGRDIAGLASYRIARLGLARTFQLVRVLDGMDCRENIKAGLAFQKPHLPATDAEVRINALLDRVGLAGHDRSLKADGITIVLVEHVMNAVRALCDRCVVMSSGRKIAEGATADVLSDAAVVKAYLGGVAADA